MNKELQDKLWNILPKEFKEEMKRMWSIEVDCAIKYKRELHKHRIDFLYELFGDNLTSDIEGEEMLIVSRKRIQSLLNTCKECDERRAYYGLLAIFGSKCLPDKQILSNVEKTGKNFNVDSLEPKYKIGDVELSQNYTENCDNGKSVSICGTGEKLEDHTAQCLEMVNSNNESLVSKKIRLEIAVKMTQAILSNPNDEMVGLNGNSIVDLAITITDALIAECKK